MWFWKRETQPRLWALAAGGILTQLNSEGFDQLGCRLGRRASRDLIARDWGIHSAEDTRQMLEWLSDEGHSSQCRQICDALRDGADITNPDLTDFLRSELEQLESHYILNWDLSRLINVARWGFTAGYLNKQDAWRWIMQSATRIQKEYRSWEESGEDFQLGFEFWRLAQNNSVGLKLQPVFRKLLESPRSPWRDLPFDTPLS